MVDCSKEQLERMREYQQTHKVEIALRKRKRYLERFPNSIAGRRESKLGANNPNWKGDEVGYFALHDWVRRRKPKPKFCEICHLRPPIDLANISCQYLRDVNDYRWLCRKCHEVSDGRMKNLQMGIHHND